MALIVYDDFSGGLNDTSPINLLGDNELRAAENIEILPRGGNSSRRGLSKINNISFDLRITQYIELVKMNGDIINLVIADKNLKELKSDNTLNNIGTLGIDYISYSQYKNNLYILTGTQYKIFNADNKTLADVTPATHPDPQKTTNLDPIKKCTIIEFHPTSTLFWATGNPDDPTAVYYSGDGMADAFDTVKDRLYPATAEGPITGLVSIEKALVVTTQSSVRTFSGFDVATGSWRKLPMPKGVGCNSTGSLEGTPSGLTFASNEGLFELNIAVLNTDIMTILDQTGLIRNTTISKVNGVYKSIKNLSKTKAVYYDGKYMLAFNDKENEAYNNKILVFDYIVNCFYVFSGLKLYDMYKKNNGELWLACDNYLLKFDKSSYNDVYTSDITIDGKTITKGSLKPIYVNIEHKPYSLGSKGQSFNMKMCSKVMLSVEQYIDKSSTCTIKVVSNYKDVEYSNQVLDESFVWGKSNWGDKWAWSDVIKKEAKVKHAAFTHQLIITAESLDNPLLFHNIGFEYELMRAEATRIKEKVLINNNLYIK